MLGIKETDEPINIEYLVTALRSHLRLYPEKVNFMHFVCLRFIMK